MHSHGLISHTHHAERERGEYKSAVFSYLLGSRRDWNCTVSGSDAYALCVTFPE